MTRSVDEHAWTTNLSGGPAAWRTWAYKTLRKSGQWKVAVSGKEGTILTRGDLHRDAVNSGRSWPWKASSGVLEQSDPPNPGILYSTATETGDLHHGPT